MTIAELIAHLQTFDQNLLVVVNGYEADFVALHKGSFQLLNVSEQDKTAHDYFGDRELVREGGIPALCLDRDRE